MDQATTGSHLFNMELAAYIWVKQGGVVFSKKTPKPQKSKNKKMGRMINLSHHSFSQLTVD